MTVESGTTNKIREEGNGSKTAFDFSFRIFAKTELLVYKVVRATDVQGDALVLDTDYTVAINGVDNSLTTVGGTVTFTEAPTSLQDSLIISNYNFDQESDYPTVGNLPEVKFENNVDKLTLMAIQLKEANVRSVKVPSAWTGGDVTVEPLIANKALLVNPDGTEIIMSEDDFDDISASVTQAAASATAAAASATAAAASATAAAASEAAAEAAVGSVKVSADDTTAGNLEAKILVGDALALSTQNPGGNETRTIDIDIPSLSSATPDTTNDLIMLVDVDDSNALKKAALSTIVPAASDSNAGVIEIATEAEIITGTSTTLAVTPGRLHQHEAVCKFWGTITGGGTPSLVKDYNCDSVTDQGVGDWDITITNDMADANYCLTTGMSTGNGASNMYINDRLVGGFTLYSIFEGSTPIDPTYAAFNGSGDLA